MSWERGKSNEELCDFIHHENKWHDWVITTAFYAAIRYADSRIFPYDRDGETYTDLDDYWNRGSKIAGSKHVTRLRLVDEHVHKAFAAFGWLFQYSGNARYDDYDATQSDADTARLKLKVVASYCPNPHDQPAT